MKNRKYEKCTYVNDQRLVSFFTTRLSLFFFDNWLQIKWRKSMLKAKVRSIFFFCCLWKIFIGEVCVNTCCRKYCVSKIDKISFQVCFSSDSLTSSLFRKKQTRNDSLWIPIYRLILRLHRNKVSNNHHFLISWTHIEMKRADKHRKSIPFTIECFTVSQHISNVWMLLLFY
jgi:hypothetical protein